ncbi:hypothetical protein [Azospirillum sp. TSO22-1]|uniref:hypothetical protein n=1 Tax=Azospirillum sp. TSO22-1 TaxID=716789 RepID=UPI000D61E120|nr:hypothetical protein [Azospirillum sp. TSO22-1]PWC56966.1 hypothetical protein TSO221_00395 [Azospirillum sp. TSO22-1]
MHAYRSLTTQRLLDVDARLAAMGRTRVVMERRLAGELRALRVVLVLWALTLAGIAGWVAG